MKLRLLALTAALLAFGYTAPSLFAQAQGSSDPGSKTGSTGAAQTPSSDSSKSAAQSTAQDDQQATLPPAIQGADPDKVKHDGGIADANAVGNRNVGCNRGMGNWYSIERQIAMGKGYAQQVEAQSKMVSDPVVTEYVNRLGQNLVRNSDAQVPFTIKVIDSDSVNAMALPGGFFYVNSGLILAADEEAELAGVMAHEIAHVAACHWARENTRGNIMNLASIPLIFVGGAVGYAGYEAAGLALPLTFLKFSRGFEAQADYLGLQYMYKAGYDPQAFVAFFEKVQAMEKKKPGTLAKAFDTHPQTPDRIQKSQEEIATILPARPQYLVSTSEFDDVKARLAALENRRKMVDQKDGSKPSLRRTTSTDNTGTNGDKGGDDRPTLKRRSDNSD
jgi:predicted Zn-dependent protease